MTAMSPTPSFLDELRRKAEGASAAEDAFRREVAERTKMLADDRAFGFRKLNLMRGIAEVVATAESEEIAVAAAAAVLRTKLGWSSTSETRDAIVSGFAPVAAAMFASLSPVEATNSGDEDASPPDVLGALAEFERWYASSHPTSFWVLFENYMPETPVVDF